MGLDGVELVMECEDEFSIRISDADASACEIVGQLQELCVRLVQEQQSFGLTQTRQRDIREMVCEIIAEQMGIKIEKVQPESRFVQDLGID